MFIKAIPKTDKTTGKSYHYYRLCESYRLGEKVRHRSILSLGTLVELADKKDFKFLADRIEQYLSHKTSEFFDLQDKIILYDLTNTYFEGRKQNSQITMFGNSKEKRRDAKLVTLALVVNIEGFVKYSKISRGNIGETTTLEAMLNELSVQTSSTGRKPLVVMDAGIADEDNLKMLKSKGYDYLCVTRSKLKDYVAVKNLGEPVVITDRRDNPVELLMVEKEGIDDSLLYVRSERKATKELSMHENFTSHFETGLNQILQGIQKKGGTKKAEKVWERIGRLKEKYPSAPRFSQKR